LQCPPELETFTSTFNEGNPKVDLNLKALSGGVYFEALNCPPTDLCDLARDVKGLMQKFEEE
jgi:hypothetical protein